MLPTDSIRESDRVYVHFARHELTRESLLSAVPARWGVRIADVGLCTSVNSLFSEIAQALQFPGYFGMNWDAFEECVIDLAWLGMSSGLVLYLAEGGSLWQRLPSESGTLVEVWLEAARKWEDEGIGLHLVFGGMDSRVGSRV